MSETNYKKERMDSNVTAMQVLTTWKRYNKIVFKEKKCIKR